MKRAERDGDKKRCTKCQAMRPLDDYHRSKRQSDGRVSWCKDCARANARYHRARRIEYWRAHDRARNGTPERRARFKEKLRRLRSERPEVDLAHRLVQQAIKKGALVRQPCEKCGATPAEGHHDDYSKPLDVRWLCQHHHSEHHAMEMARRREGAA